MVNHTVIGEAEKDLVPLLLTNVSDTVGIGGDQLFTLATPDLVHSSNWVVCEVVKTVMTMYTSTLGSDNRRTDVPGNGQESQQPQEQQEPTEVEIEVLKKVGVLRTDSLGGILAREGKGPGSPFRKIHALFV